MQTRFPIELRFGDLDPAGHVHNVVYFHYLEGARVKFMHQVAPNYNWTEEGFVVGENYIKYISSIFLQDKVEVELFVKGEEVGNKSFKIRYNVYANDKLVSEGFSTMVCMNFKEQKTIDIPPTLKGIIDKMKI